MRLPGSALLVGLGALLLCGCGVAAQSSTRTAPGEPDCSFRSPGTCWTVASRFPEPRAAAVDSLPTDTLSEPPTVLAAGADTAAAR
jgi:hypothetical protein